MDEVYDSFNVVAFPAGQTGGQMFGWFRKEIEDAEGLRGPEDAHRGLRRQGHAEARRRAAADRRRRDLSVDGARHDRRLRMGRPLRRREARLQQGRQVLLHAGRHGARGDQRAHGRQAAVGQLCRRATRRPCATPATMRRPRCSPPTTPRTPRRSPAWSPRARSSRCCRRTSSRRCAARSKRCSTRRPRSNAQFKKILTNWRQFRAEQHRWFSIADTRAELAVYRTDPQR